VTPNELDDLFRANSERATFTPRDEEWDAMRGLLETEERQHRQAQLVSLAWFALFAGLIIWGTIGAYQLTTARVLTHLPVSIPAAITVAEPEVAAIAPARKVSTPSVRVGRTRQLSPKPPFHSAAVTAEPETITRSELGEDAQTPAPRLTSAVAGMRSNNAHLAQTLNSRENATGGRSRVGGNSQGTSPRDASLQDAMSSSAKPAYSLHSNSSHWSNPQIISSRPLHLQASILDHDKLVVTTHPKANTPQAPVASARARPVLSFGLLGAGEVSSVGMSRALRWGARGGAVAHLQLGKFWEGQIGLTYGQKSYYAEAADYNMPADMWVGGVAATATECKVHLLEMPILLTYHLVDPDQQSGVFLSGGVTSYYLSKEKFSFNYNETVPNQMMGQTMKLRQTSLLAALQLQVGYRFKSQQVAYRLSPFVSIPIDGLGYGDVQLYTGGLSVELEFGN